MDTVSVISRKLNVIVKHEVTYLKRYLKGYKKDLEVRRLEHTSTYPALVMYDFPCSTVYYPWNLFAFTNIDIVSRCFKSFPPL